MILHSKYTKKVRVLGEKTAIVATLNTFQDALSISSYAYESKVPIFFAGEATEGLASEPLRVWTKNALRACNRVDLTGLRAACFRWLGKVLDENNSQTEITKVAFG